MTNQLRLLLLLLMGGALLAARWADWHGQPPTRPPHPSQPYRRPAESQLARPATLGPRRVPAPSARFAELRSW